MKITPEKVTKMLAGINMVWLMIWFIYIFVEWSWLRTILGWAIGSSIAFNFHIWKKGLKW